MSNDEKEIFFKIFSPLAFLGGILCGFIAIYLYIFNNPDNTPGWILISFVLFCWGSSLCIFNFMKRRFGWFEKNN